MSTRRGERLRLRPENVAAHGTHSNCKHKFLRFLEGRSSLTVQNVSPFGLLGLRAHEHIVATPGVQRYAPHVCGGTGGDDCISKDLLFHASLIIA